MFLINIYVGCIPVIGQPLRSPKRTAVFFLLAAFFSAASSPAKPVSAGIVDLTRGQVTPQNTIGNLARHAWSNRNVSGMRIRTHWDYVQPVGSKDDWTGIDEALRLGGRNKKFIGLSVVAGINTPQWVYNSGATKYKLRDGSNSFMPIPWESAFINQWSDFIHRLGARYNGNPTLQYIVMTGLGQQTETYLAKTHADAAALTALGGPSAWVRAAKQIIAAYADAFPNTPFFMTMAIPFPSTDPRPLHDTALLSEQQVVDWAVAHYPGRFGLMTASLNANSNTGYYPNMAIYTYQKTQPTGFQMLASNISDGGKRNNGTLNHALSNGVQLRGNFVEVYEADVYDPHQQSVLAAQDAALKAAAGR